MSTSTLSFLPKGNPQNLVIYEKGNLSCYAPLEFSDFSNKQQRLHQTAHAIRTLAKDRLENSSRNGKALSQTQSFQTPSMVDSLVNRWMRNGFGYPAQRLDYSHFSLENVRDFFLSLERQAGNILGQWTFEPKTEDEKITRKLMDAVFYFGEALFLKDNLRVWGKRLLKLQTQISRWPSHFSASQKLQFCPQEVRSLDWLAVVCAYVLSDYMKIEKEVEFEIYNEKLKKSIPYYVDKRFDLVGELWAFGLVPKDKEIKAPAVVLIRGTQKNPLKEGFWGSWWLNANPDYPGASICTSQLQLPGHRKLIKWMRDQNNQSGQKLTLVGHSLGGTIAVGLSISEHQLVEKACVFNAPIYRKMAVPYLKLIQKPKILQFQNCHDPICQLQTTDIGQIFHLDYSQRDSAKAQSPEYFDSIASFLPCELLAQPTKTALRLNRIVNCAYRALKWVADLRLIRFFLLIEPIPTVGDFLQKICRFPRSIQQFHSVPSTLHKNCLVLKCTPADLNKADLITLRLVFQWICRTFGFLALSSVLSVRRLSRALAPRVYSNVSRVLRGTFSRTFYSTQK